MRVSHLLRFAGSRGASRSHRAQGPHALLVATACAVGFAACGDSNTATTDRPDAAIVPDTGGDVIPDLGEPEVTPDVGPDEGDVPPDLGDADGESDVPTDVEPDGSEGPVGCASDQCDLDGACFDNGAENPDNPCEACLVVVRRDGFTANDAGTCDDGDSCTTVDICRAGVCVGTESPCDDGDACTTSVCDLEDGTCSNEPIEEGGACDDGDPCTVGDLCLGGLCITGTTPLSCATDNPCLAARCEPGVGCVFEPIIGLACDDGDACTSGDACNAEGFCEAATAVSCDDGSLCTIDRCDSELGCVYRDISNLCADDNVCTDAACDPALGCVYPFNTDPCDDGTLCTANDTCSSGVCRGTLVPTDDDNVCTDDFCDPLLGAISTPNTLPCDDANACTVGDRCADGSCIAGTDALICDDGNFCTDDACDPDEGCVFTNHTRSCDDNSLCTINDTCGDGSCDGTPVNCDDGNPCTNDFCAADRGCINELISTISCRPQIIVDYPPRGATLLRDGAGLTTTGRVSSGAGPITSFTINGQNVTPAADGSFSYTLAPDYGGNGLVYEATDSFGSQKNRVQGFLWASSFGQPHDVVARTGILDPGIAIDLGQSAYDKLEAIFVAFLGNFPLEEIFPPEGLTFEFLGATYRFTLRTDPPGGDAITFGTPTVELTTKQDALGLQATIPTLRVYGRIAGSLCTGNLTLNATSMVIRTDIRMRVVDNQLSPTLENTTVALNGFSLNASCALGFLLNAFSSALRPTIENALRDALADALGPVLGDVFQALAIQFDLPLPSLDPEGDEILIQVVSDFSRARFQTGRGGFELRAGAYADRAIPYDNLGSMLRNGCGTAAQTLAYPRTAEVELALADDLVNQILYGAWRGGLLETPLPDSLLEGVDLASFGISDLSIDVSALLQPTASDCADQSGPLTVFIGDLRLTAVITLFGSPLDVVIYANAAAPIQVSAADGEIGFGILDVEGVDIQVDVAQEAFLDTEGVIADLIRDTLIPNLVGSLTGESVIGFPLPEIDLSGSVPGLPPGTGIAIEPSDVLRVSGNTVIQGALR